MHKFLLAALATTLTLATLSLPTEARVDTFRDWIVHEAEPEATPGSAM